MSTKMQGIDEWQVWSEQLVRSARLYRWHTSVELKPKDQQDNLKSIYISQKGTMWKKTVLKNQTFKKIEVS